MLCAHLRVTTESKIQLPNTYLHNYKIFKKTKVNWRIAKYIFYLMLDFAKALRNLIDQIGMNLQIMTTLAYSSSWHAHDLRPKALVRKAKAPKIDRLEKKSYES